MNRQGETIWGTAGSQGIESPGRTDVKLPRLGMERGGVDGNVRYDKAPKPQFTKGPKKKYDGMSALEYVKADIRKKHGKGAIIDTKKKK